MGAWKDDGVCSEWTRKILEKGFESSTQYCIYSMNRALSTLNAKPINLLPSLFDLEDESYVSKPELNIPIVSSKRFISSNDV